MEDSGKLKDFLDGLVDHFERPAFIAADPIAIPHGFDDPRDREIVGLFAALLAWGRRQTVLSKMAELCERMQYQPYRFVMDFKPSRDANCLTGFKHRTFQPEDALWLVHNLSTLLRSSGSIERLFAIHMSRSAEDTHEAIEGFSASILSARPETPRRLAKHLARPSTGSACKRLNMYVRWMVRPGPFDLGIWQDITTEQLILPLDIHSGRQARRLGMLTRRANDWQAALELTRVCRKMSPDDPCRYDLALFGIGAYDVPVDDFLEEESTPGSMSLPME